MSAVDIHRLDDTGRTIVPAHLHSADQLYTQTDTCPMISFKERLQCLAAFVVLSLAYDDLDLLGKEQPAQPVEEA